MKLLKDVNRLFGTLGLNGRDERPLDFRLTQEDIASELHYPQAEPQQELRVTLLELAAER